MQASALSSKKDQFIEYGVDGVTLLRYVYQPDVPRVEVPKPYFHPLRTLSGEQVTHYRPHDHRWHTGLSMTMSVLSGMNFWGGNTYVRDKGYMLLNDQGRIDHQRFAHMEAEGDHFRLDEEVLWKPDEEKIWLRETRQIAVTEINRAEGYWILSFSSAFHNVSGQTMSFGSPTTNGRPLAGYGSLFWRGPREFTGGRLVAPDVRETALDYMGAALPWLAYVGAHDNSDKQSTLLFIDDPTNPRYPNKWFVRTEPYACASFSFMFDETYELAHDARFSLSYRVAIFDGAQEAETLARIAGQSLPVNQEE
jgi:hypothetical protein